MRHALAVSLALALLAATTPPARASCMATTPEAIALVVTSCAAVDTAKITHPGYAGVLVDGKVDAGHGKAGAIRVWIPASEHVDCKAAKPKAIVKGQLDLQCCDGDPNPPCLAGLAEILTHVKVTP